MPMICDLCKQSPATIHLQEIVQGQSRTLHVCPACAKKNGLHDMALQGASLAELLVKLTVNFKAVGKNEPPQPPPGDGSPCATCPSCGWDDTRLAKTGRLGCERCYDAFSDIVANAVASMHKAPRHMGKTPGRPAPAAPRPDHRPRIAELTARLNRLVAEERFEEAAAARDQINALKAQCEAQDSHGGIH